MKPIASTDITNHSCLVKEYKIWYQNFYADVSLVVSWLDSLSVLYQLPLICHDPNYKCWVNNIYNKPQDLFLLL